MSWHHQFSFILTQISLKKIKTSRLSLKQTQCPLPHFWASKWDSCHNSAKYEVLFLRQKIHSYFVLFFFILRGKLLSGFPSALLNAVDAKLCLSSVEKKKNRSRKLLKKIEAFLWQVDLDYVKWLGFGKFGLLPVWMLGCSQWKSDR